MLSVSKSVLPSRAAFPFFLQCKASHDQVPLSCSVRERGGRYGCGRKERNCSRAEDEENGKHLGTEAEDASRVQRAGGSEERVARRRGGAGALLGPGGDCTAAGV